MEVLTVSASLVGLLAAGASIVSSIQNLKETPSFVRGVITEVESITACVRQLQSYLDGAAVTSRSRTSLVLVEQVQVVLTSCIATFSDLKRTLDKLGLSQPGRPPKRMKWILKEQPIAMLLLRLQGSRVSLNLMLTTLSCVKMEEALECSTTLRSLVMKTLESNEEIARRLDSMQAQMVPPSIDAETRTISQGEQENEAIQREALGVSHMDTATDVRATSAGFAFDRDLQSTRVYGRVAHRNTSLSLPSSTGQSRGWSLSELTLSDVSNISIVSLPISVTALYDGESYQSYHQDRQVDDIRYRKSRTPCIVEVVHHYTVSSIDIAEAAALWPPCSIELWMYKTHLDRSILEQFFSGGELNGHAILLLQFKHLANIVPQLHQRRRLWGEIQRLQSCIFDETLKLEAHGQCSSGMINPHTIAAQTATGKQDTSEFLNINEEYLKHLDCARAIVRQSSTTGKSEHSDTKGEVYLEQTVEPVHGPRLDTWQDGRNLVGFPSERIVSPQKPLPRKPSDFDPLVEQIIRANASADERNRTKKIERSIIVCLEKSRSSQLLGAVFDYNLPSPEIAKHC